MSFIVEELAAGIPEPRALVSVTIRLLFAIVLGAVVGFQREHSGKTAGLRTHMLVSLGSTLFVLVPLESGMPLADTSRVVQGIATGIGFIGAGAILKLKAEGKQAAHNTAVPPRRMQKRPLSCST